MESGYEPGGTVKWGLANFWRLSFKVQFICFYQAYGVLFIEKFPLKISTEFNIIGVSSTVLSETTELTFWDVFDPF